MKHIKEFAKKQIKKLSRQPTPTGSSTNIVAGSPGLVVESVAVPGGGSSPYQDLGVVCPDLVVKLDSRGGVDTRIVSRDTIVGDLGFPASGASTSDAAIEGSSK